MPAKIPVPNPARPRGVEKTVFIVDDHSMLRRGLTALISGEPDLSVSGEAATCEAALAVIDENPPDLAIVDLGLEESDGMDLIRELKTRHPDVPVLVLSMHDESIYAERSLRTGARGYVTKRELDDTILVAIHRVLGGEIYLSPKMAARFAEKYLGGGALEDGSPLNALSDRQLEVFRLVGRGHATREIAARLGLSVKTIESHRENIKQKLSLQSGAALIQRAVQWADTGSAS